MAFVSDHQIYDALPISNDALDKGSVELLRAAISEIRPIARQAAGPVESQIQALHHCPPQGRASQTLKAHRCRSTF
jgi:hypothetical protein